MKEYFSPDSKMLLDVCNTKTNKSHSIELRADVIARVFKAKYDSGVKEERSGISQRKKKRRMTAKKSERGRHGGEIEKEGISD